MCARLIGPRYARVSECGRISADDVGSIGHLLGKITFGGATRLASGTTAPRSDCVVHFASTSAEWDVVAVIIEPIAATTDMHD